MNGREYERPPQIVAVYDRLRRAKRFKDAAVGPVEESEEVRVIRFLSNEPTRIAKSEFPVTLEQLDFLGQKIDFVRNWLFGHGQDFTHHPDVQVWEEWRTPEELERLYWYENGPFTVTADVEQLQPGTSLEGIKLLVNVDNDTDSVEICFNFDETFELTFGPVDDEELADNPYSSSKKPLDEMTQDEFAIITFYLDQYLQRTVRELNN